MSKNIRRSFGLALCAALVALNTLAFRELSLQPDGKLHVHFLDVGQGDAIFLVTPLGKQVLVDGGPDLSALEHLGEVMPFMDRRIDLVVLTHPDADHVTALPQVIERYQIDAVMLTGVEHGSGRYDAFLSMIKDHDVDVLLPDPQKDLNLGDGVILDIIWPDESVAGTHPKDQNALSITMRVLYNNHAIMLAGDIEKSAEAEILASGTDVRSEVLKAGHHGSRTSSSTGFLLAVAPDTIIISAGEDNSFGHPHPEVLERFAMINADVLNTAKEGTISLVFD